MSEVRLLLGYLKSEHFESEVAREVFNDLPTNRPAMWRTLLDRRVIAALRAIPATTLIYAAPKVDKYLVPAMSPAGRRNICQTFFRECPSVLSDLPNCWSHVRALGSAVSAAENFNAPTLDRLRQALTDGRG